MFTRARRFVIMPVRTCLPSSARVCDSQPWLSVAVDSIFAIFQWGEKKNSQITSICTEGHGDPDLHAVLPTLDELEYICVCISCCFSADIANPSQLASFAQTTAEKTGCKIINQQHHPRYWPSCAVAHQSHLQLILPISLCHSHTFIYRQLLSHTIIYNDFNATDIILALAWTYFT